jgi:dipeptidyl-peptidase III
VPLISPDVLDKVAERTPRLRELYDEVREAMFAIPPYGLGFPSHRAQSAYYPGSDTISEAEIALVSRALEEHSILSENTRIRKTVNQQNPTFTVLQASIDRDAYPVEILSPDLKGTIRIQRGDHSDELSKICSCLTEAIRYAANDTQQLFLSQYIKSFQTGSLDIYRESLRTWIKDKGPRVENIFGFVEPYRDPYGIRAEFEGLVGIADIEETKDLMKLVEHSHTFIKRLPWAQGDENDGKGPFEKALFDPPDFTSIHSECHKHTRRNF